MRDAVKKYSTGWIHHKQQGQLEKKIPQFLDNYYDKLINNLDKIFTESKNHSYRPGASINRLENLHNREFSDYKEDLIGYYEANVSKHGHTKFNHFISWLELSNDESLGPKHRTLAEFIASCTIGHR